jgi:hypothetical protein
VTRTPTHIKQLKPDPHNRRQHTPRNLGMLADALHAVGAARSIVIDETNEILAGNGVIEAAATAGITKVKTIDVDGETIVAVRRRGLSPDQKRDLALYDNRTAELADWDLEQIKADLDDGVDLSAFFTDDELSGLMADLDGEPHGGLTDPDDVPEPRATDITPGDLFELGDHRLLCGDSTKAEDVARVNRRAVDLCLTDPPYGVGESYESYTDTPDALKALVSGFFHLARQTAQRLLLTPGNKNSRLYPEPDWTLCWFVPAGTGRNPWGFTCWQPVLAYGSDPYLAQGKGSRPDALNHTESSDSTLDHPCPKPVGVWSWFLERGSANKGESVYDPFLGSGTTIIAAEQLGRTCYAIEIEPQYCQVTIDRWEAFTGKTAVKVGGR